MFKKGSNHLVCYLTSAYPSYKKLKMLTRQNICHIINLFEVI